MEDARRPYVGVAVFVLNSAGKFLAGKRKGSWGPGTFGLPGGHLEYHETFETCASRETLEATGLHITNVKFLATTNDFHPPIPRWPEMGHGVTIFMTAKMSDEGAEPENVEPSKCEGWRWQGFREVMRTNRRVLAGEEVEEEYFEPLYGLVRQCPEAAARFLSDLNLMEVEWTARNVEW